MNLTARDRRIVLIIVPLVLVGVFWFLLLSPKRAESAKLEETLSSELQRRDDAKAKADLLENARQSYAKDYATVVRLGKAIPSSVDMPSLLVQLEQAAKGTSIRFSKVTAGTRADAPAPPPPPAPSASSTAPSGASPAPSAPAGNAAPGGTAAGTAPGAAAETAGEGVKAANDTTAAQEGATGPSAPVGAAATGAPVAAPGLDSLPLDFSFRGRFFDMADFFHEMKRFVYLSNKRVRVEGRLMTIDGFKFDSTSFPVIQADVQATVYLSPKSEGTTAGATPVAPAPTAPTPVGDSAQAPPTTPAAADAAGGVQ